MFGFRKFPSACVAIACMLLAAVTPQATAAQDDTTVTVYLQPVIAETGDVISPMCLQLAGASNTGCDEDGDGYIEFQDMHPGTYQVLQETIIAGIVQLGDDVTITVADSPTEQYFTIEFHELSAETPTEVPTVAPTVAPPDSGSQDTGNGASHTAGGTSATALPNTGSGSAASVGTLSLATLALLAVASVVMLAASVLRWRRPRA